MARVLIVDDIADNTQLLKFELEDDGHEVFSLDNGQACLDSVADVNPDVILLDIMMPVLDGMSTLRELKGRTATRDIPVIMISANDVDEQIINALDMGAHDYVNKPFVYPILAARMRSALRLQESQRLLALANQSLAKLASQDPLTGVYNRRYFFDRAASEFSASKRHERSMGLIMLDVDNFKALNDKYGHTMGDTALAQLCHTAGQLIRAGDFIGRMGGEEFAICCPETDLPGIQSMAERIRRTIEKQSICYGELSCCMTVSLGVTHNLESDTHFEQLYERADQLLYQAKEQGRNRVIAA
ncbi:GGDEF domain-containing protein [Aurantivibrio plasticivorans]